VGDGCRSITQFTSCRCGHGKSKYFLAAAAKAFRLRNQLSEGRPAGVRVRWWSFDGRRWHNLPKIFESTKVCFSQGGAHFRQQVTRDDILVVGEFTKITRGPESSPGNFPPDLFDAQGRGMIYGLNDKPIPRPKSPVHHQGHHRVTNSASGCHATGGGPTNVLDGSTGLGEQDAAS
jgi:hypothetical protein